MGFVIDIHIHSERHSGCSKIPPERLVQRAVECGLHGLIFTEHHYQWSEEELEDLRQTCGETAFLLLAGFEYSSCGGDILVYGLSSDQAGNFEPYRPPAEMLREFQRLGACCVAAHPTRAGMGFDADIASMPFDAVEVRSVNMQPHEQRLAAHLAKALGAKTVAASDAHRVNEVGMYALEFDAPIKHMADFVSQLRSGSFQMSGPRR